MKLFKCQNCGHVLNFESRECESCGCRVGYLSAEADMVKPGRRYRFCENADFDTCNWLILSDSDDRYCRACRHNRTIPDLSIAENLAHWRLYEVAKHRLIYSLIDLGLPLRTRTEDPEHGLTFDILAETREKPHVVTGHRGGIITLNLKEADDAYRATERLRLGEPCRTLLGHLRHESGHYYWDLLITGNLLDQFREVFGDERQDYGGALQSYYANGSRARLAIAFYQRLCLSTSLGGLR